NVAVLIALAIGAAGGWVAASGRLDSLLKAETKSSPVDGNASGLPGSGECCAKSDRAAALAAVTVHNQKVSANLQKDGKKPNILFIMGADIGCETACGS